MSNAQGDEKHLLRSSTHSSLRENFSHTESEMIKDDLKKSFRAFEHIITGTYRRNTTSDIKCFAYVHTFILIIQQKAKITRCHSFLSGMRKRWILCRFRRFRFRASASASTKNVVILWVVIPPTNGEAADWADRFRFRFRFRIPAFYSKMVFARFIHQRQIMNWLL